MLADQCEVVTAAMLDAFEKGQIPGAPHLPPCLITDMGEYSLAEWPARRARYALREYTAGKTPRSQPNGTEYRRLPALQCVQEHIGWPGKP